jgi:hypothetical protein
MDPITAGIGITALSGAVASGMSGIAGYQQNTAEANAAQYNATTLTQQATSASNVAGANEAESLRKSQGELGEQAAAAGEANIGTGGTIAGVEKQSATNARLDALNIWYGGELERHQALDAATLQKYYGSVDKSNATTSLIGGGVGAGTSLLTGAAKYGAYQKYGVLGSGGTF